jgi:hypothetical protein
MLPSIFLSHVSPMLPRLEAPCRGNITAYRELSIFMTLKREIVA